MSFDNMIYLWKGYVRAQKRYRTHPGSVSINFEDFNLQYDSSCQYDWLEVRDGNSSESKMLGDKLCGDNIPDPIVSTGQSITLLFKSDASYNFDNSGFKLVAESISNWNFSKLKTNNKQTN